MKKLLADSQLYKVYKDKIDDCLFFIFDQTSKLTCLILENRVNYVLMLVCFFVFPVTYGLNVMELCLTFYNNPPFVNGNGLIPPEAFLVYKQFPIELKCLATFDWFFTELVCISTSLAFLPSIKNKMVKKYSDENILEKRGFGTPATFKKRGLHIPISAVTKIYIILFPLALGLVVATKYGIHLKLTADILALNAQTLDIYRETGNPGILKNLQTLPPAYVYTSIQQLCFWVKNAILVYFTAAWFVFITRK